MKEIKTPLRYPGGKTRAVDFLMSYFPDFKEYREPFIGGGSVFIKSKQIYPNAKFWINDLYYDLFCFWQNIKKNKEVTIKTIKKWKETYPNGRDLYTLLTNNLLNFTDVARGSAFFVLNRITFSGTSCSGGYSQRAFEGRFTDSSIKRAEAISNLLQDVKITNLDYSDVLNAEGEDAFIYLDPPYYTTMKSALYGNNGELHKGFDHERFAEEVKKCKHKWLITYDDCEYIRNLYKDYNITSFDLTYGMKNVKKGCNMKGKEVIIKNY